MAVQLVHILFPICYIHSEPLLKRRYWTRRTPGLIQTALHS